MVRSCFLLFSLLYYPLVKEWTGINVHPHSRKLCQFIISLWNKPQEGQKARPDPEVLTLFSFPKCHCYYRLVASSHRDQHTIRTIRVYLHLTISGLSGQLMEDIHCLPHPRGAYRVPIADEPTSCISRNITIWAGSSRPNSGKPSFTCRSHWSGLPILDYSGR